MNTIPAAVLAILEPLVREFEGCRLTPYQDANGNWTIGFGHKIPADRPPCSQQDADNWLDQDLALAYGELIQAAPFLETASPSRQAALTDFVFNLGIGQYDKSTLHSAVLAQAWQSVKAQLALWVHAGGKVQPGLVRRRAAEIALIDY